MQCRENNLWYPLVRELVHFSQVLQSALVTKLWHMNFNFSVHQDHKKLSPCACSCTYISCTLYQPNVTESFYLQLSMDKSVISYPRVKSSLHL